MIYRSLCAIFNSLYSLRNLNYENFLIFISRKNLRQEPRCICERGSMMIIFLILSFFAGDDPVEVKAENLIQVASQAYVNGPGRMLSAQKDGLADAQNRVGPRFQSLGLSVTPEISVRDGERGEHQLGLETTMSLANLPRLSRQALHAEQVSIEHQDRARLMDFLLQVQQAYGEAFLADTLMGHVRELEEAARKQESDLEALVEKQLVSKLDLYAQKTLRGEYAHEIREMQNRLLIARSNLERLLAQPVSLSYPEMTPPQSQDNPFTPLVDKVRWFPSVLWAEATAQTAETQALLAEGHNAPTLSPTLNYRDEPGGGRWLGAGASLKFSLRPKKDEIWARHQAAAQSSKAQASWETVSQKAELLKRAQLHDNNRANAQTFNNEVLEPLRQQVDLYGKALEKGHLERRLWLKAQADLHEAEHQYLVLIHGLWADEAQANIMTKIVGEGAAL